MKMNVGNILKVADAIEQASVPGLGFNMGCGLETTSGTLWRGPRPDKSGRGCGTAGCLAGWTVVVISGWPANNEAHSWREIREAAESLLDLGRQEAASLFDVSPNLSQNIAPVHAVRCLRNLAITGKVDWEAAMKGDEPELPPVPARTKAGERV